MKGHPNIVKLIQAHKALEFFDYSLAVDWAINMLENGNDSENILMLSSFSEPYDKLQIEPFVSAVLGELGLDELEYEAAQKSQIHYHLSEILNEKKIREHLYNLAELYLSKEYQNDLSPFYFLYHAWIDLEEVGENFHYKGAHLLNIEEIIKFEASRWIKDNLNPNSN